MLIKSYKLQSVRFFQLFSLIFISRVLVSLTFIPSLNFQETKGDLLLATATMLPLLLLFFLPIYFYMKQYDNENLVAVAHRHSPILGKSVSTLYFVWFVFVGALNVTRFVYFVTSEMNVELPLLFIIFLSIGAACYGAYLGIQSLGKVGTIMLWVLLLSFIFIMAFSLKYFKFSNFSPVLENPLHRNLNNGLNLACNTAELSVLLMIVPRIKEKIGKKFIGWMTGLVLFIFSLYFVTIGTLGDFAKTQTFPVFSMSQISGLGILQRLDAMYTGIWIAVLFLKTAVFLCAGAVCVRGVAKKIHSIWSIVLCAVPMVLLSAFMANSFSVYWHVSNRWLNIGLFFVFVVLIPLLFVLFKRKFPHKEDTIDASHEAA